MEEDLYNLLKDINRERIAEEHRMQRQRELSGENIYLWFCVWCNCHKNGEEMKKSPQEFAKWLKLEDKTLTFWQKKSIAENHFGYKFEWDYNKREWKIGRIATKQA